MDFAASIARLKESTELMSGYQRKLTLATVALFASAVALPATQAAAQQMEGVSYKNSGCQFEIFRSASAR
jgi:hypothetical protein